MPSKTVQIVLTSSRVIDTQVCSSFKWWRIGAIFFIWSFWLCRDFLTFEKYVHMNLSSEEFLNSEYIRLASFVINEIWRIKQEKCATTTRMHSSRMRTARLLPISHSMHCSREGGVPSQGCTCPGGCTCPEGCTCQGGRVPAWGGLPAQGCTCPGGLPAEGCTCPGGCTCQGEGTCPGGVPALGGHNCPGTAPPVDRQTCVKT